MAVTRTVTDALARSSEADLVAARARCGQVLAAARDLAAASGHDPDVARCDEAGCRLVALDPDGQLCSLVHQLAISADTPVADGPVEVAHRRFLAAVVAAMDAVRTCRQTAHPSGVCWFAAVDGRDGCAEVLRLAHRLS